MASEIPLLEFSYGKNQTVPITVFELDSISLESRQNKPNRHVFYEIFLVTEGKGTHTIDFNKQSVEPNSVFLVSPYQVHSWKIEEKIRGHVILFEDSALLGSDAKELLAGLYSHDKLAIEAKEQMDELVNRAINLKKELLHNNALHKEASSLQLQLLLIGITRMKKQLAEDQMTRLPTSSLALLFTRMASKHYALHRQSKWYADKLNTSTSYLSQAVRAETGGTPGEYLRGKIISEIKRMLLYTDSSVEVIARDLNFESASYFSRFFRRETGQTPREFVRSMR